MSSHTPVLKELASFSPTPPKINYLSIGVLCLCIAVLGIFLERSGGGWWIIALTGVAISSIIRFAVNLYLSDKKGEEISANIRALACEELLREAKPATKILH